MFILESSIIRLVKQHQCPFMRVAHPKLTPREPQNELVMREPLWRGGHTRCIVNIEREE